MIDLHLLRLQSSGMKTAQIVSTTFKMQKRQYYFGNVYVHNKKDS